MNFKLIGDGSITSSVAITTLTISNGYPAVPFPQTFEHRGILRETSSGYTHGYNRGTQRRQWPISLRLLSFANYRSLLTIFNTLGASNWLTWEWYSGAANAGSTTQIADSVSTGTIEHQNGWFEQQIGFITSAGSAAPEGEFSRCTLYAASAGTGTWTFSPAFSATVDASDSYVIGWPVQLVGTVTRTTPDGVLWNVDFTFQEYLMAGVG